MISSWIGGRFGLLNALHTDRFFFSLLSSIFFHYDSKPLHHPNLDQVPHTPCNLLLRVDAPASGKSWHHFLLGGTVLHVLALLWLRFRCDGPTIKLGSFISVQLFAILKKGSVPCRGRQVVVKS